MNKLQQLIRESIGDYMKAIEEAGEMAGHKSKMEAAKEAIEKRDITKTLDKLEEEEKMMIDEKKVKEMANEKKALEKYLAKLQKQLDKLESKADKGKKVEATGEKEEIVDETMMDENDPENGPQLEEEYDTNIYEMLHMQKLAGVLSETEYKVKVQEAKKKKASASMAKKEKPEVVKKAEVTKKARVDKDIDKKAKSLKEEVLALFEGGGNEGTIDFGPFKNVEWYKFMKENIISLVVTESDNFRKIENSMTLNPNMDTYTNKERSFLNGKVDKLANEMSKYLTSIGVENEVLDNPIGYGQEIDNLVIEFNADDLDKIK